MEQSKIWNHFQSPDAVIDIFQQSLPRYRHLANHTRHGETVLNIGVGRGGLERLLLQRGIRTYSLDPGPAVIAQIREDLDLGEQAQTGWSQALPFADTMFDAVVMTEVLEHLSDEVITQSLGEISRVLKPGGRFMGTVPADENLHEGHVLCPHCGQSFHRWGHVQSFSEKRLHNLLQLQFNPIHVSRQYFGDWAHLNWKGRITWCIKKVLVRLGVRGSTENLFFLARKATS